MRRVIVILLALVLGWSVWWAVASNGLRSGIASWLAARSAEGWQAEAANITGGGFPTRIRAQLTDLALADPDTGLALRTDVLQIAAPAWWPGNVTITLDEEPITLASPFGQSQLSMQQGVIATRLAPGTALELQSLGWTAGPWVLRDTDVLAQADDLTLVMQQDTGPRYSVTAAASAFAPGTAARLGLRLPAEFPEAFDALELQAEITFDRPWDRRALSDRRPQPRQIRLKLAEARWGDLRLNFAADLSVDDTGIADGTVSLQAENWRTMLDLAQNVGALPPGLRDQADAVLAALARASGNEATLDVDLVVRNGVVLFGFLPVAQAPRLVLR